jgi:ribosomal-protein-serine acetyltransferase
MEIPGEREIPREWLTDGELVLRRWRPEDTDEVFRAVTGSLESLRQWAFWAIHGYTEDDAAEFIATAVRNWESGEAFGYAVLGPDEEIIGSCALMARIGPGALEIGYWLAEGHTGRGIMTRAAGLLTEEAFRIGVRRVEIVHDAVNTRSAGIPARLGFREIETRRTVTGREAAPRETGWEVLWRRERPC